MDLMTAAQVAELYRRDRATITVWAQRGKIPFVHKSPGATGAYLFDREEIERLRPDLAADESLEAAS